MVQTMAVLELESGVARKGFLSIAEGFIPRGALTNIAEYGIEHN
jgi:hypothetical protein